MANLIVASVSFSPMVAEVLARRGGGLGTFIRWIVTGVASGQPVPLAFAGVGGLGVGWLIYSKVTGE